MGKAPVVAGSADGARAVLSACVARASRAAERLRAGDDPDALRELFIALQCARFVLEAFAPALGKGAAARARALGPVIELASGSSLRSKRSRLEAVSVFDRSARNLHRWLGAASAAQDVEIERKYLLSGPPPRLPRASTQEIWQGWIPGGKLRERLRRVRQGRRESFFRTVKLGRGIERVEVEDPTPRELFERLWPLTRGRRVLKKRHVVRGEDRTWEIDEFLDRPLWLAEVELPTTDAEVKIPEWLAPVLVREVTDEDAYVNINLAR